MFIDQHKTAGTNLIEKAFEASSFRTPQNHKYPGAF
jgi:hypothetical protein